MSKDKVKNQWNDRMKCAEAARYLGVSPRTLRDLTKEGTIPYYRISSRCHLYDIQDLDQFLEDRRIAV
jgi:excisionase family DNA binding protein